MSVTPPTPYPPLASLDAPWQVRLLERFEARHGRPPLLDSPRGFADKLAFRVLLDHDPLYRAYGSKAFAPYYVRTKVGDRVSFPERYGVYSTLTRDDLDSLPDRFVLKGSHGSGLNALVEDRNALDPGELDAMVDRMNEGVRTKANAQGRTDPGAVIIAEEWLDDGTGSVPTDYKFHCFHTPGEAPRWMLYVLCDRFGSPSVSMYDADLSPVSFGYTSYELTPTALEPPDGFERMVDAALRLSAEFDYIRVDLQLIDGEPFFGELTPFPDGGNPVIDPAGDEGMGALWTMRPHHLARRGIAA